MIIKKLLVPFINDKILLNAEHCYIATASVSEPAFDFLMSKIPPKCKVDIVTGLDFPTDPEVLTKALKQYPNRINFKIYTKNTLHSNAFIFDLPFRKMVAFIGSGNFSIDGFKNNEELSYKVDTEKGVEEIKTWFRSYFEYAEDLTENMVTEYEEIFPSLLEREARSKQEKQEFNECISRPFNWEKSNLKDQYFQEENYRIFEQHKVSTSTQLVHFQRTEVQKKLLEVHEQLKPILKTLKLFPNSDPNKIVSSLDPHLHLENKVKSMWLTYGRGEKELKEYHANISDMICMQIIIRRKDVSIWLTVGNQTLGKVDRGYFRNAMKDDSYRKKFFDLLKGLGEDYWIEVACEKHTVTFFKNVEDLEIFTARDSLHFDFKVGRTYQPNHPDLSSTLFIATVQNEITKLHPLYKLMKDKSHE
ncbi:MAG: phospholipase D family protein [Opitutaceae bacterium]|nr:phospholipase D family protein [Cytophagales bacterium]